MVYHSLWLHSCLPLGRALLFLEQSQLKKLRPVLLLWEAGSFSAFMHLASWCHKSGHFKHCCRSKGGLREVKQNTDSDDSEKQFLGTVSADVVNTTKPWTITLTEMSNLKSTREPTSRWFLRALIIQKKTGSWPECTGIPLNGTTGEKLDVCRRFTGHLESKVKTSK